MRTNLKLLAAALTTASLAPLATLAADANNSDTVVTLYNNGPAVVWQTRQMDLQQGTQSIDWPSVPASMLADSLWFAGDAVSLVDATVAAQHGGPNPDPQALLARRVGQSVTLIATDSDRTRQATLVSVAGNAVVVKVDGRMEWLDDNSGWRIAWPAQQPAADALKLSVDAESAGEQPLTLAYQRADVNWHASYTGRFNSQDGTLQLQSLAVLENKDTSPLQADEVALIAGDVARTSDARPKVMMMARTASADSAAPQPQSAGGYYRYDLEQPVAINAGGTQILALMPVQTLQAEREYYIEDSWYRGTSTQRRHASMRLSFDNTSGQPLPAGPVRIYGQGRAMLLGENQIDNTPPDAPVTLTLGRAFDVTSERRVTASSQDDKTHKQTLKIDVYNARNEDTRVHLIEHFPRNAQVVSESAEHDSDSAGQARWQLSVPAHGKTTLTYTVQWHE